MHVIDIISFCLSLLGIYGPILLVHHLLPRKVVPLLSTLLDETQELLGRAEGIGAVPPQSEYKVRLDRSAYQFAMMRTESNHARGIFRQLRIAFVGGLTYRLLSLYYQVESIKSDLELEVDKQRLNTESGARALVPGPAGATAIPINNVDERILPLPATAP